MPSRCSACSPRALRVKPKTDRDDPPVRWFGRSRIAPSGPPSVIKRRRQGRAACGLRSRRRATIARSPVVQYAPPHAGGARDRARARAERSRPEQGAQGRGPDQMGAAPLDEDARRPFPPSTSRSWRWSILLMPPPATPCGSACTKRPRGAAGVVGDGADLARAAGSTAHQGLIGMSIADGKRSSSADFALRL